MIGRSAQCDLKMLRYFWLGKLFPFLENLFENPQRFVGAHALKLVFKVINLQFKIAVLAQKHRVFLRQSRFILLERGKVLHEQRGLIFHQVNFVFGQAGSCSNSGKLSDRVGGTHK
jgi:hypothetical protein